MADDDSQDDYTPRYPLTADNIDIDDEAQELALIDQVLEHGNRYMKAHWQELIEKGIIDSEGNLLKEDLPPDMEEGSDRDVGG